MSRNRAIGVSLAALLWTTLLPAAASAQQSSSGIAGVVRDTSGGVLPGVTVEAASPALIEKVRSVVTNGEGRYNVVDLRPGTYVVTFSLLGFKTVRREGIALTGGFTATVNADLEVGTLEETVTVSGAAPLVDTQNTRQQNVLSNRVLEVLPTSTRSLESILTLTPGVSGAAGGVGGSQGTYRTTSVNGTYHGKQAGGKITFDGMNVTNTNAGNGAAGYIINGGVVEEMSIESGGASAESNVAGFTVNFMPKEGSNSFRGFVSGVYADENLQSDNATDALRARGLTTLSKVVRMYDFLPSLGGPIKKDKLWFFYASRWTGIRNQWAGAFVNKTIGTRVYTADLSRPGQREDDLWSHAVRLTWQASAKNKVNVFLDAQHNITKGFTNSITTAPEAVPGWDFTPQGLYQVSWTSPRTSRLLLEGGVSFAVSAWPQFPLHGAKFDYISILEASNAFRYNAADFYVVPNDAHKYAQRFSMSYVTGSHAFKTGFQLDQGFNSGGSTIGRKIGFNGEEMGNVSYTFLNGAPNSVTLYATPYETEAQIRADLGLYAQDQWTIQRLTLNLGLRFDYFNGYVPPQSAPASAFVPERSFGEVTGVPAWTDLNPRLGAAYDVFGNGRTALKMSLGRYVNKPGVTIANALNPLQATVNRVNRTWNDGDGDYFPDCDLRNPDANGECGAFSDRGFGQLRFTTRYADDALHGFGVREYLWDLGAEVQHQLRDGISLTAGYYRNWAGNFLVTDNVAVTPADHSPYCITAPRDPRLPGGGGYQVCGLYDVAPAKYGLIDNVVRPASDFGKQTRTNNFVSFAVNSRFASGLQFGGGVDAGRTVNDRCFVIDSPQELLYCRVERPFSAQTQLKVHGSYPLPGAFVVSGIFRNEAALRLAFGGETLSATADYPARNAEIAPTLGRNLAACGARVPCTTTATVPLIQPYTRFEGRLNQLDLRLTKSFQLNGRTRLQANFDMYNALNASPVLGINTTYGPRWLVPTQILDGRLFQLSGQLSF